ncbi:HNH endonuclease [Brachybacterium vulturis]|uniref:HNH endonuclease n=1 Tax=Brachybacterium vulturis TaxID=2017484 RepID=A0A291GS15_9MICO|nr:HNH endonuclease signature motif containing protein [Brachybacterium vulturis]ATG52786.1 HNH endonuclease [Brachybacterium vulturis]
MDSIPMRSGDHPGEDAPRQGVAAPSGDVLEDVLGRFGEIEAGPAARALVAQILAAALMSFTRTRAVRDPLPDTAPGSAEEALAVLAGIDHLRASLAAVDATWQVAAEERIRRDDAARGVPASQQGRGAGQEIALARRISPVASSFSQAKARRLVQNMPGAVDRLWSGAMTDQQASAISGALDGVGADTCRRIDDHLREHPEFLQGKGFKRLQSDIRDLVRKLEPETSRERAERAARARHVRMEPLEDGMARVTAVLRGIDAVGLMHSLRTRAESLRASGTKDSLSALEADLLVEDALRTAQHDEHSTGPDRTADDAGTTRPERPRLRPGLDVGIVITDTALLGREDDAEIAELEGYGTIPAHIVRDTLLGRSPGHVRSCEDEHPDEVVSAFYRRLYRSPRTSELVAMESRARAFPAGLARMIRWRDTTCRTPWCNAKIRHSDHVVPHHRGGPTSFANGQGLCARCNLLKEHGLWVLSPLSRSQTGSDGPDPRTGTGAGRSGPAHPDPSVPPGAWIWSSPHGAVGTSPTPPLITPWPDPPPEEDDHDDPGPPGTSPAR